MLKRIPLLGWLIMAVLLIDAGLDLRRADPWGAARTLIIVALLPYVFRQRSVDEEPSPPA